MYAALREVGGPHLSIDVVNAAHVKAVPGRKSGRAMLDALVAGERDPHVLAGLARGVLRNKTDDLRLALTGR